MGYIYSCSTALYFSAPSVIWTFRVPSVDMATPLHQLFAQSVQAQRNDGSSKEALLDGQDGLAARWSRATAET